MRASGTSEFKPRRSFLRSKANYFLQTIKIRLGQVFSSVVLLPVSQDQGPEFDLPYKKKKKKIKIRHGLNFFFSSWDFQDSSASWNEHTENWIPGGEVLRAESRKAGLSRFILVHSWSLGGRGAWFMSARSHLIQTRSLEQQSIWFIGFLKHRQGNNRLLIFKTIPWCTISKMC